MLASGDIYYVLWENCESINKLRMKIPAWTSTPNQYTNNI